MDKETATRVGLEASTAVGDAMLKWIDAHADRYGCDPRELLAIVGKSLVIEGCLEIGKSIGAEFDEAMAAAKKALSEFRRLAIERKAKLAIDDD